jgi:hypothetical protein
LNLDFATITSPLTGTVGRTDLSVGVRQLHDMKIKRLPVPGRTSAIKRHWCARSGKAVSKSTPRAKVGMATFKDGKK